MAKIKHNDPIPENTKYSNVPKIAKRLVNKTKIRCADLRNPFFIIPAPFCCFLVLLFFILFV
jgi:hypothetical protein